MKKQLAVVLGLSVLATPAFASKARLQALGEDTNGSFYINDNRNVFLNASEVNNHKDLVSLEFGASTEQAQTGSQDTTTAPNAEGGIFRAHNNMVYGAQFGRNLSFNEGVDELGNTANAADNALDVFVGGDAGIKWGAQLTYAASENDAGAVDDETKVIDLAGGVTAGDIAGYLKYGIQGKSEAANEEIERKNALEIGASYKFNNYTAFGQYGMSKFEKDSNDDEYKDNNFQVGVGRSDKLNDKATLFTKASYVNSKTELDVANTTDKQWSVPVVVGLEYDATSWLVLRASISQAILSKVDEESAGGRDGTLAETTTVAAGASLKFGELSVDGVIGNNPNGSTPGDNGTSTGAGQVRTDSLMSRASVTYRF